MYASIDDNTNLISTGKLQNSFTKSVLPFAIRDAIFWQIESDSTSNAFILVCLYNYNN